MADATGTDDRDDLLFAAGEPRASDPSSGLAGPAEPTQRADKRVHADPTIPVGERHSLEPAQPAGGHGPADPTADAGRPAGPRTTRLRRAAVVYNPIKVDIARLRHTVTTTAERAEWGETLWFETTLDDAGQAVTAQAIAAGADVVLAVGGDGTVRAVAEGLRDSGIPLGLVPMGTGNLLARNLDLGLSFDDSISTAFSGTDRTIDLGVVDIERIDGSHEEHVFLVMAGLGIDAKMIAHTSSKLKKAVGWLAYIDGGMRALADLRPVRLRFSIDGSPERAVSVHTVIVGNCGLLPGGILLIPDAKPDDGILDIMALRPQGPFGWVKIWNKITWENGVLRKSAAGRRLIDLQKDARDVTYVTGTDLSLTVEEPQEFQLDGDEFGEAVRVHAWVDPGALTVRVVR